MQLRFGLDMKNATCSAVRHMIEFLCSEYSLDRVAAYMLCSVAGNLRLHEVASRLVSYGIGQTNSPSFRSTCRTMWYVLYRHSDFRN